MTTAETIAALPGLLRDAAAAADDAATSLGAARVAELEAEVADLRRQLAAEEQRREDVVAELGRQLRSLERNAIRWRDAAKVPCRHDAAAAL